MNTPLEESDLKKMTDEEMKKKFGSVATKVVEYKEGAMSGVRAARMELWPFLLLFLLVVLGVEMGVANGVPRSQQ